jgi:hypothetical protein
MINFVGIILTIKGEELIMACRYGEWIPPPDHCKKCKQIFNLTPKRYACGKYKIAAGKAIKLCKAEKSSKDQS